MASMPMSVADSLPSPRFNDSYNCPPGQKLSSLAPLTQHHQAVLGGVGRQAVGVDGVPGPGHHLLWSGAGSGNVVRREQWPLVCSISAIYLITRPLHLVRTSK